ncbi:MAG: hypothetical protein AAGH65_00955 [Pseudomonadota bacterium]
MQKNNKSTVATLLASDPARAERMVLQSGAWRLDVSRTPIDRSDWQRWLSDRPDETLLSAVSQMLAGEVVNPSEQQAALHVALRAEQPNQYTLDTNHGLSIQATRQRMLDWAGRLHRGESKFQTLLHIGIGGSDLGPRLVAEALNQHQGAVRVEWLSTLDGRKLERLLSALDPATTAVVIASKSFTTVETRLQAEVVLRWLTASLGIRGGLHCWAATTQPERAVDMGVPRDQVLTIPTGVGGRFSLWSSVGMSAAASIGPTQWQALLHGAQRVDRQWVGALTTSPAFGLARTLAALRREFNYPTLGIVSYEPGLRLLVDYLQQLIMESLGKRVTATGQPLDASTAPLVFGGSGTDVQHAQFQALHQGSERHPMILLGSARAQHGLDALHREQLSHLLAQADALVYGVENEDPQRAAPGNNPVVTLLTPYLDADSLGQLLATFEHATFLLGCLWSINPFDQWGVEDGKRRADTYRRALDGSGKGGSADPAPLLDWLLRQQQDD